MRRFSWLIAVWALVSMGCHRPAPDVLLVTFDTTRWDHVGYATGREELTPTLDRLAGRGTWFEVALSSTPLTLPSHATILTGTEPYNHGVRNNGTFVLSDDMTTMAEILTDAGYRTHAVVSAFVLDSRFGLDQGFAGYDDDLSGAVGKSVFMSREIDAGQISTKAVRWLDEAIGGGDPFFLWLHFFDPHADYDPPDDFLRRFPGEPYAAEIAYADAMLGEVIAVLDRRHRLNDTLVVFTADHGESLGEHGEETHGIFIYEATTRVPLFFAGPGVPSGGRITTPARAVDILPTVLDLLGLAGPDELDGRSLREAMAGEPVIDAPAYLESFMPRLNLGWNELRGLRSADHKVIRAPRPEAYHLAEDPREATNLARPSGGPAEIDRLFEQLDALVDDDPITLGSHSEARLDSATREALEALGYTRTLPTLEIGERPDPKDRIGEFETLRQARELIDGRKLDEARSVLDGLLDASPENLDAILALAYIHRESGETAAARPLYELALHIDPGHDYAMAGLAETLVIDGQRDRAEALLMDFLKIEPDALVVAVELGAIHFESRRFDEAERVFRAVVDRDPTAVDAAVGLADCLTRRGEPEAAIEVLEPAYEGSRADTEVIERLASAHQQRGDLPRAVEFARILTAVDPESPTGWNNLAAMLAETGRYDAAVEAAERAHRLDPDRIEIRANLGAMLVLAGETEDGLVHLDAVLVSVPDNEYLASLRAQALEDLGRTEEAVAAWTEVAEDDPAAGLRVALLQLESGDRETARATVRDAIERGGEPVRALAMRHPALRELAQGDS